MKFSVPLMWLKVKRKRSKTVSKNRLQNLLLDEQSSWISWCFLLIPSGKRLHSYWKSPFLMGKSTINGHVQ